MSNIVERAKEIIEWRKTGILTGEALRERAREIREELGDVFNMGEALHQAENATNKEALLFVIKNYDAIKRLTAERDNTRHGALEEAAELAEDLPMFTDGNKYGAGTEQNCYEAGQDDAARRIAAAIRAMKGERG